MKPYPSVAIVVLNWNNAEDTIQCVQSLAALEYDRFEVTVIDNGSSDGSSGRIRAACPWVDFLQIPDNLGYAEGNNTGIAHVMRRRPSYILVLNNDTIVDPPMVRELVAVAEARPTIAMAGPIMRCWNSENVFAAGSVVEWRRGEVRHRGMFRPVSGCRMMREPEAVDFVAGCGILVRREFIEAAGGLDPRYYLNFEDVEWGVRAWRRGFEVVYVPKAQLWHKISASLGPGSPANTYYMTRNALLFFAQNAPHLVRELAMTRILARTARSIAAWSCKPAYRSPSYRRKRAANLLALRDFALGRFGRMGADVQLACSGA